MSILLALVLAAEAAGPNVTLPLTEYEALRKLRERPSITVVDLLRVDGSFGRRDLSVAIQGRASGTQPTVEVLGGEGFRLYGCTGEALVTRAASGSFALTPLAPRFEARCRVALDGSDRLEATALAAVLEVASAVADGELVSNGAGGDRAFSIVRRLSGGDAVLPPSVAGRYKVTLLPEESRFLYRFEVRNPNRGRHRFAIPLRDAEHVESVNAPVAWDKEGGSYRFDLPPGESTIELTGRLTEPSFAPPVAAALQYLLLESHPLIRAEVAPGAKRVGVGEVGMPAAYRGAQAFLLDGKAGVGWNTTRLEALKTAGLAVSTLAQVFFVGASGEVRGETRLAIDNQGAPALELPVQGEPTFASVDGEATFLTRDAAGRLLLPLGQGTQGVVVQSRRPLRGMLGFASASLDLPQLGAPASQATVELRYPPEWTPVYEELSPESRFHPLDWGLAARLALAALLVARLLLLLGVAPGRRRVLTVVVVAAGAFSSPFLVLVGSISAIGLLAAAVDRLRRRLSGERLVSALAGLALASLVVLFLFAVAGRQAELAEPAPAMAPSDSYGVANVERMAKYMEAPVKAKGVDVVEASPGVVAGPIPAAGGYQGLPARIEIPAGHRRTWFSRELLATDRPRHVYVLLVSSRFAALVATLSVLAAIGLGVLWRAELLRGVLQLVERIRQPRQTDEAGATKGAP